jgi:branched-chain amino acid transport system ATP-binding protein
MPQDPLLRLENVSKSFGALNVSRNVSLTLDPGARQALIGPNGAGKTTLINLISGVLRPSAGRIYIGEIDATRASAEERVRLGLVRIFQINSLFPKLTVAENVALGVSARARRDWRPWGEMRREVDTLQATEAILVSTGLAAFAGIEVAKLAYGQQRLVEVALALALEPRILLLDEPAAGLSGAEREALLALLFKLPESLAVLIIEHDMSLVFRLARKITVLVEGGILVEGTVDEVRNDPRVRNVYLGHRSHG